VSALGVLLSVGAVLVWPAWAICMARWPYRESQRAEFEEALGRMSPPLLLHTIEQIHLGATLYSFVFGAVFGVLAHALWAR
jgi:hypothetical protein